MTVIADTLAVWLDNDFLSVWLVLSLTAHLRVFPHISITGLCTGSKPSPQLGREVGIGMKYSFGS
jgi:hypothetical protein